MIKFRFEAIRECLVPMSFRLWSFLVTTNDKVSHSSYLRSYETKVCHAPGRSDAMQSVTAIIAVGTE